MIEKLEISFGRIVATIDELRENYNRTTLPINRYATHILISEDMYCIFSTGLAKLMDDRTPLVQTHESGWRFKQLEILIIKDKTNFLAVC